MSRIVQRVCLFAILCAVGLMSSACAPSASEQRGQELFDLHCASCHEDAPGDLKKRPPRLEGLFRGKNLPSGAPATNDQLRKTIIEGLGTMPAFDRRLSEADLDDLVKYLHTVK